MNWLSFADLNLIFPLTEVKLSNLSNSVLDLQNVLCPPPKGRGNIIFDAYPIDVGIGVSINVGVGVTLSYLRNNLWTSKWILTKFP